MSRREFRGQVEGARPLCSIALVAVASSMLGLSGAVQSAALIIQAVLIIAGVSLRNRPLPWQQQPALLRLGTCLALITGALLGAGGLLRSLATSIMLIQGVQIFDARPRRTEYPIVTLALCQILLAANLGENPLFAPLLLIFLFAVVWTLLLHTLHVEAAESGDPTASHQLIDTRLFQMTLLSTGLTALIAALIFLTLPRMNAALHHPGGFGFNQSLAGFSNRIRLGTVAQIRKDPTIQLRVSALRGKLQPPAQAYFRGIALDQFDGWEWSVSPSSTQVRFPSHSSGTRFSLRPGSGSTEYSIVREPIEPSVVFAPGRPISLEGSMETVELDDNGNIFSSDAAASRMAYRVEFQTYLRNEARLAQDEASTSNRRGDRYLRLPDDPVLSKTLYRLALQISQGATTDAERARRIERYLIEHGSYTDTPPRVEPGSGPSPVAIFLEGGLAGHCEYFASSMALLARALGMPSRIVNGFAGGQLNAAGNYLELAGSDAHAWVEIHYKNAGWVRYDPTPADLRMRPFEARNRAASLRGLFEAMDRWWFVNVADFNRNTQIRALRSGKTQLLDLAKWFPYKSKKISTVLKQILHDLPMWLILVSSGTLLTLSAPLLLKIRKRRTHTDLPEYARALKLLRRHRLMPKSSMTARDFAQVVSASLPAEASTAFSALTETYQAKRYGGHKSKAARAQLRKFRNNLGS